MDKLTNADIAECLKQFEEYLQRGVKLNYVPRFELTIGFNDVESETCITLSWPDKKVYVRSTHEWSEALNKLTKDTRYRAITDFKFLDNKVSEGVRKVVRAKAVLKEATEEHQTNSENFTDFRKKYIEEFGDVPEGMWVPKYGDSPINLYGEGDPLHLTWGKG